MKLPIIPGRSTETEAIATLLNPANSIREEMLTVTAGAALPLVPLTDRQQIVLQVITGSAIWVKWNGVAAIGNGMRVPLGSAIAMKIVDTCNTTMIAEGADTMVCAIQLGGKF